MRSDYYELKTTSAHRIEYLWLLIKCGFLNLINSTRLIMVAVIIVIIEILMFLDLKDSLNFLQGLDYLENLMLTIMYPFIFGIADIFLLYLLSHPFNKLKVTRDLGSAGLINNAEEPPFLYEVAPCHDEEFGDCQILRFKAHGVPIEMWIDMQTRIENAINKKILYITQGKELNLIDVTVIPADATIPNVIEWDDSLIP